jgi:hypothetical protein
VNDGPVLVAALVWHRLGVGVVPVLDLGPKQLVPGIRWEEDGPLRTEEAIRAYWADHPGAQLAITLDNSAYGGPRLCCVDDDSGKHDSGGRERPRPLGGYRESTRGDGTHDVFRYTTELPPDLNRRTTGIGGFVDILAGGILYVAPTVNRGVGEYRVVVPLEAGFPEYPTVNLGLDAASGWVRKEWLDRARGGISGGPTGQRGDFSECYRLAVCAVVAGATDEQVREAVGCDHPEWSPENIHRTVGKIRRWLGAHPRPGIRDATFPDIGDLDTESPVYQEVQDWNEDTLRELARELGVDPTGLPKGELRKRVRDAGQAAATPGPEEPRPDVALAIRVALEEVRAPVLFAVRDNAPTPEGVGVPKPRTGDHDTGLGAEWVHGKLVGLFPGEDRERRTELENERFRVAQALRGEVASLALSEAHDWYLYEAMIRPSDGGWVETEQDAEEVLRIIERERPASLRNDTTYSFSFPTTRGFRAVLLTARPIPVRVPRIDDDWPADARPLRPWSGSPWRRAAVIRPARDQDDARRLVRDVLKAVFDGHKALPCGLREKLFGTRRAKESSPFFRRRLYQGYGRFRHCPRVRAERLRAELRKVDVPCPEGAEEHLVTGSPAGTLFYMVDPGETADSHRANRRAAHLPPRRASGGLCICLHPHNAHANIKTGHLPAGCTMCTPRHAFRHHRIDVRAAGVCKADCPCTKYRELDLSVAYGLWPDLSSAQAPGPPGR